MSFNLRTDWLYNFSWFMLLVNLYDDRLTDKQRSRLAPVRHFEGPPKLLFQTKTKPYLLNPKPTLTLAITLTQTMTLFLTLSLTVAVLRNGGPTPCSRLWTWTYLRRTRSLCCRMSLTSATYANGFLSLPTFAAMLITASGTAGCCCCCCCCCRWCWRDGDDGDASGSSAAAALQLFVIASSWSPAAKITARKWNKSEHTAL